MHRIGKLLREKRGETLIESLASILIFTFASILLLTMLSTATDINRAAKEADRAHFDHLVTAEMAEGAAPTGVVVFSIGEQTQSVKVSVYGDTAEKDGVYAYYAAEETIPAEETAGE